METNRRKTRLKTITRWQWSITVLADTLLTKFPRCVNSREINVVHNALYDSLPLHSNIVTSFVFRRNYTPKHYYIISFNLRMNVFQMRTVPPILALTLHSGNSDGPFRRLFSAPRHQFYLKLRRSSPAFIPPSSSSDFRLSRTWDDSLLISKYSPGKLFIKWRSLSLG